MSTVTSSAINTPRIDYNPDTGLLRGLLIEEQRINELVDKRDLNGAAWATFGTGSVTQDQPGIDRVANKAWTITDSSAANAYQKKQAITVPDDSNLHIVSIYIKKTSATHYCGFSLALTGGSTPKNSASIGFVGLAPSNGAESTQGGNIDLHEVHDAGDYWRLIGGITNNTTGNVTLTVALYPAANTTGAASVDATTTGSMIYDWGQVELNAKFASSPIPDGVGAVTRAADIATSTITGGMPAEFSVVFYGTTAPGLNVLTSQHLFDYSDNTADNRFRIFRAVTTGHITSNSTVATVATINGQTILASSTNLTALKVAVAIRGGDVKVSVNGGAVQTFTGVVATSTFTDRDIGQNYLAAQQWNGWIKNFTEYHRPLSDAELIAASTL